MKSDKDLFNISSGSRVTLRNILAGVTISAAVLSVFPNYVLGRNVGSRREWKPTFKSGGDIFEVSGSTYAWEVHDEGVERVLDNMQEMAAVNSVYLIALMHHEPRPLTSDVFAHNPVREKWYAEDSRVYWHPDRSLYGRIKPDLSDHEWLSRTDWLKVVIDAAHRRGMKAGVEISHTTIDRTTIEKQYPECMQRTIQGKPIKRFYICLNNPDVQTYTLALFEDLAKNYDVDYIQTCMRPFGPGNASSGGCFCDSCVKAAGAAGFDLAGAIRVLKDDPQAQPQLNQWLKFRRQSVTQFYKRLHERIKAANPRVDFRLNTCWRTPESMGMYLHDLRPYLDSVRVMEYTEQRGDLSIMQRKHDWLTNVRAQIGNDMPLLSAVAVRPKAFPEIIRKGVNMAVDCGVEGITLGHYDGSTFSMLRAVREGLFQAGVKGVRPVIGTEIETMELDGFEKTTFLYEPCVLTSGKGTARFVFDRPSGTYDLRISCSHKDRGGRLRLYVEGAEKDNWQLHTDNPYWRIRTVKGIPIKRGDEIRLIAAANPNGKVYLDHIETIAGTN
jgi:hypothetical protein